MRPLTPLSRPAVDAFFGGVRAAVSPTRLVWFELKRLARNPAPWLAVAYVSYSLFDNAYLTYWGGVFNTVLTSAAVTGTAIFVAALVATVREARYNAGAALPVAQRTRVASLLISSAIAGAASFLIPYAVLIWASEPAPIAGSITPVAFVLPLMVSALGGVTGVMFGVWTRSWLAAPALLLTVVANQLLITEVGVIDATVVPGSFRIGSLAEALVIPGGGYGPGFWWLAPAHLAYLGLALLTVAALALLRLQPGRRRRAITAALALVLLAGSATAYWQRHEDGRRAEQTRMDEGAFPGWAGPKPKRSCTTRGGITYCAYDNFKQWIPYWEQAAAPVAAALPEHARRHLPRVVQQTFDRAYWFDDSDNPLRQGIAVPNDVWTPGEEYPRRDLAEQMALPALGLVGYREFACSIRGQARLPVYLWLVVRDSAAPAPAIDPLYEHDLTRADTTAVAVAMAMLEAPEDRIVRGLDEHWERLISPDTRAAEAARLLGLRVTASHRKHATELITQWRGGRPPQYTIDAEEFPQVDPVPADGGGDEAPPPCR
ncbi:hypothetical protein CDO52_18205 [Nocardiopsis gilva YIM 90087]|uniref:Uncharacterized protein n=1 Tax=Nocardiopsis gilva YIM 90087 TaxID=1235441 RepID=A0A223S8M7_9ACTN|nr:hypothetical protein [Nocardiopsis gilva]ASU84477.1 hypothetical protein CDO52_18205 [Nocardiopsis gilva YIM 90087]